MHYPQDVLIGFVKISQVTLIVAGCPRTPGPPWPARPLLRLLNNQTVIIIIIINSNNNNNNDDDEPRTTPPIIITTSGQSNLTASPPQTDGSIVFARWGQCALPPILAHCRHLANMIELVLSSAHPSPQPKRQIDRFGHFYTAHRRKPLYFTMGDPFPRKLPLIMRESGPHLTHDSLGHSDPTIQTASRSVQPFSHR